MRGVVIVATVAFVLMVAQLVGSAALSPLGEHVKGYDSIDDGDLNGTNVINNTYEAYFKWMPLIMFSGMGLVAVLWYMRRERVGGRVPPP